MSALTKFLFRLPYSCRTPAEIIGWWEGRRAPYNAAVGTAGLVTLGVTHLIAALPPFPQPLPLVPSLVVAAAYGVIANVAYTFGWIAELALRRLGGDELEPAGAALFRYGLVFSVGLTLFPIALVSLTKIVRVIF